VREAALASQHVDTIAMTTLFFSQSAYLRVITLCEGYKDGKSHAHMRRITKTDAKNTDRELNI
jgi:hypothetical protein